MASLKLVFSDRANPRLVRVEFAHDNLWSKPSRSREQLGCSVVPSPRLTAGSAAVSLLAINARLALLAEGGGPAQIALAGASGTPAASLHASLERAGQDWHVKWFGFDDAGRYLIARCFPKGEPEGQFLVWIDEDLLPRKEVRIVFDHEDISDDLGRLEELHRILSGRYWNAEGAVAAASSLAPPAAPVIAGPRHELRIAILRGGDFSYINDIADAFKSRLEDLLGQAPDYVDRGGSNGLRPWTEYSAELDRQARTLVDLPDCDYYVAIGTQATHALRNGLGEGRLGRSARFLFLGVTSPIKMGLVEGLFHRNEPLEIAGVGYNDGEVDAMVQRVYRKLLTDEFFHLNPRLLAEPRLTFAYRNDFQQDVYQASSLRSTDYYRSGRLAIQEFSHIPTEADLAENLVHFGWFTFEVMFQEDRETRELLKNRVVIATTRRNVKDGWAAMGVSVDDRDIGKMGADLLHSNFVKNEPLGRMPIPCPALRHWVHLGAARRLGLNLPKIAIDTADRIFDQPRG